MAGKGLAEKTALAVKGLGRAKHVAAIAALALLITGIAVAAAQKSVILAVDGTQIHARTFARTVGDFLKSRGVVLLEKDEVTPSPDAPLSNGAVVTVNRAQDVCIAVDGRELSARTRASTVGEALADCGVALGQQDEVSPALDTPVAGGMVISVTRVRTDELVEEAPLEYGVQKKYTVTLPQGVTRVAREGSEGIERRTWRITYRDGKEAVRVLASREIVVPPVDELLLVGSGMSVSRGGENIRYAECREMLASGYTYTGRATASGVAPHYGVAAVDPSVIPIGTRMYVDGYGYATALDLGSSIVGNRIDLFFESRAEALEWGLRWVKVYILN